MQNKLLGLHPVALFNGPVTNEFLHICQKVRKMAAQ
jgi:hypothetical protein